MSKMNSEETVKAIKRVEKEIERRKSLPIYTYNTGEKIHEKQVAFHKCKKPLEWNKRKLISIHNGDNKRFC